MNKEGENLNAFSKAIRQLRQGFSIRSAASEDVGKLIIKKNSFRSSSECGNTINFKRKSTLLFLKGICCLGYIILCASLKRMCS